MNQPIRFSPSKERLRANYFGVVERVRTAASKSSRNLSEIKVIGVTKYVDVNIARWLVEMGCDSLGESKPQSLWDKQLALSDLPIDWHLIGHLQRNKVKKTIPLVSAVHSLDSQRLLAQVLKDTSDREIPLKLLLEINVSNDREKTGMVLSEAESLLSAWQENSKLFPMVSIVGLMGMGSVEGGVDKARKDFERLRNLRDDWEMRFGMQLRELSMGMSDDFQAAIEEGATMVRIGSVLFQ